MNKYIKYMAFAMMAVFSLAFLSCGDDDDDEPANGSGTQNGGSDDAGDAPMNP